MQKTEALTLHRSETNFLFFMFGIWSFILLCRPQDYLTFFGVLRPALTFGLITFVINVFTAKSTENIFESRQFQLYILLVLVMVAGIPFSYYRRVSFEHVLMYAVISTLFFYLFYQLANSISRLRSLLFTYCCGALVYSIYILLFGKLEKERISFGTMFDPNDIVFFVISFLTFNLLFVSKENSGLKRLIAIINLAIGLMVIFKTGSRGGLVACITVCSYLLFVRTQAVRFSFPGKAVIIFLACLFLLPSIVGSERYKTILDLKDDYNVADETGRVAIWKIGVRMIASRPVTGVGVSSFSEGVGRDREIRGLPSAKWQAAHNSIIQIGAETGVIGLFLFCLITLKVFRITKGINRSSGSQDLIAISEMTRVGFIGQFVCSMFLSQAYSVYWIFYIAMSAVLRRMADSECAPYEPR